MLQMIKNFRYLVLSMLFIYKNATCGPAPQESRSKMFLYSSKLPSSLVQKRKILRSHVIDVLLSTQKHNVVFSKIPKIISKSNVPQNILKYKIRTSLFSPNLYNITFSIIDVDSISVTKEVKYIDIPRSRLIYQFRLHLYELILGKKLSNAEETKFNKKSEIKIKKFLSSETALNNQDAKKAKKIKLKKSFGSKNKSSSKIRMNTKLSKARADNDGNIKASIKNRKGRTLWDLLKDQDTDSSWDKNLMGKNVLSSKENDKKEANKRSESKEQGKIKGPPNPFLKTRIQTKPSEKDDIRLDLFHIAWRSVSRSQEVTDLIGLSNNFLSILGMTFEWVIHNPLNIENLYFRTGFELDKSLKTEPIKLSDHSLFRLGFGFKLPFNIMPNFFLETNSLVFANLNTAGEGFQDNIVSVYWSTAEIALLTQKIYLGFQYSQSIDSSNLLEGINFTNLKGTRTGLNLRYFSDIKIFTLKLWADLEYRVEDFNADNLDFNKRKLRIYKKEYAFKLGVYF